MATVPFDFIVSSSIICNLDGNVAGARYETIDKFMRRTPWGYVLEQNRPEETELDLFYAGKMLAGNNPVMLFQALTQWDVAWSHELRCVFIFTAKS